MFKFDVTDFNKSDAFSDNVMRLIYISVGPLEC